MKMHEIGNCNPMYMDISDEYILDAIAIDVY